VRAEVRHQDAAFPYLVLQQGRLDHLKDRPAPGSRPITKSLVELFDQIAPHLPATCTGILDVGGGMGGIDVLITRHYRTDRVSILDGSTTRRSDGPPRPDLQRPRGATRRFLMANGVRQFQTSPAGRPIRARRSPTT
jgi:hypothetical protein